MFGCMDLPECDGIKPGHTLPKIRSTRFTAPLTLRAVVPSTCVRTIKLLHLQQVWRQRQQSDLPYSPQHDRAPRCMAPKAQLCSYFLRISFQSRQPWQDLAACSTSSTLPYLRRRSNHLFIQSATSCGLTSNGLYNDCGGATVIPTTYYLRQHARPHIDFRLVSRRTSNSGPRFTVTQG